MIRTPGTRAGLRCAAACALAALALLPAPAAAQLRAVRLTLDNDAYNFWVPPTSRPDREYTNGVGTALETAGGPLWAARLAPGLRPCDGAESADSACVSTTWGFGQKIFAPRKDGVILSANERPYAGWLYLSATGRVASPRGQRSVGVEVGVSGPPSLGEAVHKAWHRIGGFWEPVGWGYQVGFEPAVAVRYDESRLLGELRAGDARVLTLAPEWGASVGNLLTEAHAGVRATAGVNVPHPWSRAADRGAGPFSLYAIAAARQDAVARNLFLDGTLLGDGPRVDRRPFVSRYELGGGVRYGHVTLEYRAATRTREYETEPDGHTYSTFELTYRPR